MNYLLGRLNGYLNAAQADRRKFDRTLNRLKTRFDCKIGLIDFKFFDERRLKKARREKLKGEYIRDFKYAINQRYLGNVCRQYIDFKSRFDVKTSMFLFDESGNILLFCHFGTSKNDPLLMQWILWDERYVKLNIRT